MGLTETINGLRALSFEKEWFEFKENWFIAEDLGQYISALGNSAVLSNQSYAYFVWGVNNKTHQVVGTDFDPDQEIKNEPLKHFLARQLNPECNFSFHELEIDGKRVVCLVIPKAVDVPFAWNHKRYIRIGSSKEDLMKYPKKETELFQILANGYPTLESSKSEDQELSFSQLFTYYAGKGIELREKTFRKNLHFFNPQGELNKLALIMSDDSMVSIRVSLFSGKDKTSPLYSTREFGHSCILVSLEKILDYCDAINVPQADEEGRHLVRNDVRLFDPEALREALVNAFEHNWWLGGYGPSVTIFSDRIEIISRGELAPGQTKRGFLEGESVPVNQRLADIFLQLHISEQSGRGVPKIISKYGEKAFEFNENSIKVTIPFRWLKSNNHMEDKVGDIRINKTQAKILAIMRDDPNVTLQKLQGQLSLGRTAIQNNVTYLRKNGIIERVGANKSGYWRVNSKDNSD